MIEFHSFFEIEHGVRERDKLFELVQREKTERVSAYYELPYDTQALEDSAKFIHTNKDVFAVIDTLVIVGIGGSSLGLKAIDSLLGHSKNRRDIKLCFLEHTDPIVILQSLRAVEAHKALFVVISKSGTTIETSSLMKYIITRYDLLHHKESLLIITDRDSNLYEWAQSEGVYCMLIDPLVGGRFSVLSSVGIAPLMLLGYDVEELLEGARAMSQRFFNRSMDHLLDKAIYYAKNSHEYPMNVLFSYASVFASFNAWYVQLWGESLGKINKKGKAVGLTPISLIGSIDQHSFLQLIIQGPHDKSVTFLGVKNLADEIVLIPELDLPFLQSTNFVNGISFRTLLQLQRESTMETLIAYGVPTDLILLDNISEKSVGMLIFYYELLTSCVGAMFKINTYDQPGVEFGKQLLRSKLTLP
ncbi:MAG: glucose-6-phosphate isomerase [Helicobacter sp.]|nr:glucose-6-phosphate isomerase [Helicobacter sp.]